MANFDAIIVGTGPGGATVARELSLKNKKVLMLEWGRNDPIRGSYRQAFQFNNLLFTNDRMTMIRGLVTGGSSVMYYGTAFDPPVEMFKKYGIDLTSEIAELRRELPIAPLKDELIGPFAKKIMESARALGYDWQKLPKFVYQDKCRPDCGKCPLGCPHGAKWNAKMFVEESVAKGSEIRPRALATKVIVENNKAVGVEYTMNGSAHREYAPLIVVAGGGIGSPLLLKASGITNVGQNFFFDPLICVMGTARDVTGNNEFPMAAGIHMKDEGCLMTDMTVPNLVYMSFAAGAFKFHKLMSHSNTLQIMVKIKDDLGGRMTDMGGIRKWLSPADKDKLAKGCKRASDILKKAGAKDIFNSQIFAAHPGGTVKVNEAVDSNLKTKFDNLYVCDCSVIPVAWGLPPTLSILALGKRLAKHLLNEAKVF